MTLPRWSLLTLLVLAAPNRGDEVPRSPAPVTGLAYHPDGRFLAAADYGRVLLLDAKSGDVLHDEPVMHGPISALAYSADRLAVAGGTPGKPAELRVYTVAGSRVTGKPVTLQGHTDSVLGLVFSRDGKLLASAGYDRTVRVWDAASGHLKHTLQDHSDSVYAVAFSPDGSLLASAGADRAVKVWDVATGQRLYSLNDAADWLYAVAWRPDGKHLAAAGVDKSVRVWEASADGGKLVRAQFAHEGPVNKLAYSPDAKTLYSLAEDRTLKAWDATTLAEKKAYPKQPETVLALAVRPDGKQLALGRYDGVVQMLDPATGKVQAEPLPVKSKPPTLTKVTPNFGQRGRAVRIELAGKYLETATELTADAPGVRARFLPDGLKPMRVAADLDLPATLPTGVIKLTLKSPAGAATVPFNVDLFPAVDVGGTNDLAGAVRTAEFDRTLVGVLARPGDVAYFRFTAAAGQPVGVQAVPDAGARLDLVVQWTDAAGRVLASGAAGVLGVVCPEAGTYTLSVRDGDYRGGPDFRYRLHVGAVPVAMGVVPLGLRRGTERTFRVAGVQLGGDTVTVMAPADAATGTKLPVPVTSPHGPVVGSLSVVVGEFPEAQPGQPLSVPGTADGVIETPGTIGEWRFTARKGERLVVEALARRYGSPLDPWVEVVDKDGRPIERAVLRCEAKTVTVLRDHDAGLPGIRLEAWNEFAMDDYVLVGQEMIRIQEMPRGPDDDTRFYAVGGARLAYLGTSPQTHALGSPVYRVTAHPPGTAFAPNGLPVVPLYYRNDDGGPGYGKDARLVFDPPADGEYRVRVGDSQSRGSPGHAYRLTVRPSRPDFTISFSPQAPKVGRDGAAPVAVTVTRTDDFTGPVELRLDGLPPGFHAAPSRVEASQTTAVVALWAEPDAKPPAGGKLKLIGRADIDGRAVERTADGGTPSLEAPGDIVTTTGQREVVIRPGQEAYLDVAVERRNGFAGRIPVEVRGLPHGVRVLNLGLNNILITERETTRRVALYAEPWVTPEERAFVVVATRDVKGSEHGAPAVTLRVVK